MTACSQRGHLSLLLQWRCPHWQQRETGPLGHAEPPGAPQCPSIPQTGSQETDQDCRLKTKLSCSLDTSKWWPPRFWLFMDTDP